jgi:hypothetical protein
MLRFSFALALILAGSIPSFGQSKTNSQSKVNEDSSDRLPVKRVVLYKNGVGYFEHNARVHGTQDLSIDFTTSQLNDVLKSLTAVDMGDGRISSVRYNSIAPLDERLKSLRLPFGQQITSTEFINAIRGSRVEVRSGPRAASGRLLSVEQVQKQLKDESVNVTQFTVLTDTGDLQTFELGTGTSVRLADADLNAELGRYLNLIGSSRARDVRRMTLTASGTGDRDIFVSYISEVPIWKSTYRIILPDKDTEKPLLQGWAIVDNTIGEDWKDVQLSLVAGQPQSFIQDISQPFYARRPVVALPKSAMLTPQTHEATMDMQVANSAPGLAAGSPTGSLAGIVKDPSGAVLPNASVTVRNDENGLSQSTTTDAQGRYQFNNLPAGNSSISVSAPGFNPFNLANFYLGVGRTNQIDASLNVGSVADTVEVRAAPVTLETDTSEVSSIEERQISDAEGKSAGDYFEYNIKQKITIGKNQSALVPILQAHVDLEKVTVWSASDDDDDDDSGHVPLRAIWLKNTSGQVIDSGTFNVLEADTFAGEGILDSIHPDERRLLSYAADPAVHVRYHTESDQEPISHILIEKGIMMLTKEERSDTKYTIRNSDTSPRQVIVEYPLEEGWKLAPSAPKAEETTESLTRFRVPVEAGKTADLEIAAYHPEEVRYELTNLDSNEVDLIVQQKGMTPELQKAFDQVLAQKEKISDLNSQMNQRKQESDQISADQARIRENMTALKGSAEEKTLVQRYTGELNAQEDRLAALRKEMADLQGQKAKASQDLENMIMNVHLDQNF